MSAPSPVQVAGLILFRVTRTPVPVGLRGYSPSNLNDIFSLVR